MERRICVRAVILDEEEKIFAVKHRSHDGGESPYWATPGGGLDVGESAIDGVSRELIEETGIKPVVGKLLFIQQFLFPRHDGVVRESMELFFHIENSADYKSTIQPEATTHGDAEIAKYEFIDPKKEYLLPEFLKSVDLKDCVQKNQPVQIFSDLDKIGK